MTTRLGMDSVRYAMIADTGYFKVYAPAQKP